MTKKNPANRKMRLDEWLWKEGHFASKDEAHRAVLAGKVRTRGSGVVLDKPGMSVSAPLDLVVESPARFVSRGGEKLQGFLDEFPLHLQGRVVLDVGSSTGGFTDCLLQNGASQVYAIDVGTHQLHEKLRKDPRVKLYEEVDIRNFDFRLLDPSPTLIVMDVSFISVKKIIPTLVKAFPGVPLLILFKPQFEADRFEPKKRGVVNDEQRRKTWEEMLLFFDSIMLNPTMSADSKLKGSKGNQETFVLAQTSIPQHIFRTYDIRGLAEKELTDFTVERIGRILGNKIRSSVGTTARIGIGRDDRISSPRIYRALSRGIASSFPEATLVFLGSVSTPMAYFAHYNFDLSAMIQITASHNPKDDNGMKMMIDKNTLFGEEIAAIGIDAQKEVLFDVPLNISVEDISQDLRAKYLDYLHTHFKFQRKFKIVLDCGNGMVGSIARDLLAPYASQLEIMYEDVDCTFPNHEADPTVPKNLEALRKKVQELRADVGFAYDGDGDRLGVVTKSGRILAGDEILMLLSELVLKRNPGSTIIGEVKCSEKLFRMIEARGGVPVMYKTGHSLIKKKMKELKAPLAGEMSGHLFFADQYFGYDDATYATLRVLEVMDQLVPDLDAWIGTFPPTFVTPELRVECKESEKTFLVEKVKTFFSQQTGAKLELIDGVRVGFPDSSWVLVRASNTQAVLVVRVEATSDARLKELLSTVSQALGKAVHV